MSKKPLKVFSLWTLLNKKVKTSLADAGENQCSIPAVFLRPPILRDHLIIGDRGSCLGDYWPLAEVTLSA